MLSYFFHLGWDEDSSINPSATEICDDQDNNCDGETDEGLTFMIYYLDTDGDGFGDISTVFQSCQMTLQGSVDNGDDCDDTNPDINPDAVDISSNGIDEDCDGMDLISATHELSNTRIDIHPNPATTEIKISVKGQLEYATALYSISGDY